MKLTIRLKGGPGSGHHGHAGRPGKVGGSLPGKGGSGIPRVGDEIYLDNFGYGDTPEKVRAVHGDRIYIEGSNRTFHESDIVSNAGGSVDVSYVHDRLNEKVSKLMMSGRTSDDDLQEAVFDLAEEELESGETIPDEWFDILDTEIAIVREDLGY